MTTKSWRVYGRDGHWIRTSFFVSIHWDFSEGDDIRIIEVDNFDKTGTNEYSIIRITRNTADECYEELEGQLWDGYFENYRFGQVEEIYE